MAEYIERKTLVERLTRNLNACNPGKFYEMCYQDAINTVTAFPAADVAPVRHGRWIQNVNPQWPAYSHDCCSVCGWWNTKNALCYDGNHKPGHSLNYCPNCGAKMDLEG